MDQAEQAMLAVEIGCVTEQLGIGGELLLELVEPGGVEVAFEVRGPELFEPFVGRHAVSVAVFRAMQS